MLEGKTISAIFLRSRKKIFINGIIIPTKLRRCFECKDGLLCTAFNNQINEKKKLEANLYLLKREEKRMNLVICFLIINYKLSEKLSI